ncbi:hypothetical protein ACHAPU_006848 [Fusarium lateritium]
MFLSTFLVHGLSVLGAVALSGTRIRRDDHPDRPVHPDIASDCTYWDTAYDESYDCDFFLDGWWLKLEEFVAWNPSVGTDCSGVETGFSYCVEVNHGLPRETDKPEPNDPEPEPTASDQPDPTGPAEHSPTQEGLISTCTDFYFAEKGDTCSKIVEKYKTFDFKDFFKWNPAVEDDCSGLWAKTWYCVGVPGTSTKKPITSAKPTPTNTNGEYSPVQPNIAKNCNRFHKITPTTTCANIEKYYSLPLETFYKWNPSVGTSCTSLLVGYWVCVGVEGWAPPKTTTTIKPAPTDTNGGHSPVQPNIAKNCNKFHKITPTTTCASIERYYSLPLETFYKWNPSVGTSCTSLLVDYWVCVGVEGWTPPKPTTTNKPTPTNGIETPSPIQPNIAKDCNKFHKITPTTTCKNIENYYNLPLSTFYKWNPSVGTSCNALIVGYHVCVSVIGWTPSKPSPTNGIPTPTPVQAGIIKGCKQFHPVSTTTTCDSIQKYYKITMAQFRKWNSFIDAKCNGLWAKYYVCVKA